MLHCQKKIDILKSTFIIANLFTIYMVSQCEKGDKRITQLLNEIKCLMCVIPWPMTVYSTYSLWVCSRRNLMVLFLKILIEHWTLPLILKKNMKSLTWLKVKTNKTTLPPSIFFICLIIKLGFCAGIGTLGLPVNLFYITIIQHIQIKFF